MLTSIPNIGHAALCVALSFLSPGSVDERQSSTAGKPLVVTRLAMGVQFQIAMMGDDDRALSALALRAFEEVDRLERILNNWSVDSDISQLNQTAGTGWVHVKTELAMLLREAQAMRTRTDGAYDVTVLPGLRLYGFDERILHQPSPEEQQDVLLRIGGSKLSVRAEPPSVSRAVEGMEIDVSSAAKGLAVDAAVGILRNAGIENAFVVAGGSTVYAIGVGPNGDGWPFEITEDTRWHLVDEAVSTSGRSWRDLSDEGHEVSHIFDPRTGAPTAKGVQIACFRGPSALEADMASTALIVLGESGTREWFASDDALSGRTGWLLLNSQQQIEARPTRASDDNDRTPRR